MPILATLYIRTPQGRIEAFSASTTLPAPLKTLLKAVDGKASTTALQAAHAALGNVERMLSLLQGHGLIADKSAGFTKPALPPASAPPPAHQDSHFAHSGTSGFGTSLASYFSPSQLGSWNDETVAMMDAPAHMPDSVLDLLAQQVADSMRTFVLDHLPSSTFSKIAKIEHILTPAQLKAQLPQYEQLVKSIGPQGQAHFAVIKQLADKLFAKAGI
jgi:hypothetical protein